MQLVKFLSKSKQQATALILALLVTSIVAVLASFFMAQNQIILSNTQLFFNRQRWQAPSHFALAWAKQQLIAAQAKQQVLHFPLHLAPKKMAQVTLSASLTDLQGKFNLNNLMYPQQKQAHTAFIRLLTSVFPRMDQAQAQMLTNALQAWLLPHPTVLDRYYQQQKSAYAAAHLPMSSVTELRLVKGFNAHIYTKLLPYLCVLPNSLQAGTILSQRGMTQINVNSASVPVLLGLSNKLTIALARQIVAFRQQHGVFHNLKQFTGLPMLAKIGQLQNITLHSHFYLLTVKIKQENRAIVVFYKLYLYHGKNMLKTWQVAVFSVSHGVKV